MVTAVVALRWLGFPVAGVGAIHRQCMSETVRQNAEYCDKALSLVDKMAE
jgi:hypothetical protein